MEYRPLGRTGMAVSAVGLGTEYLINRPREHVVAVIHEAIRLGVNYFDAFFAQPTFRDDMGVAFEGYRDRVLLAAHLGAAEVNGQEGMTRDPAVAERYFLDWLARQRTDYADVLFLHCVDPQEDYDEVVRPGGLLDLASRLRDQGKIRAIGLSGHSVGSALQAVHGGRIDVLMFPVNLAGHAVPGRRDLFQACLDRGVGLVAMKPYAGGKLLRHELTLSLDTWQRGSFWETWGPPVEVRRKLLVTPVQCLAYVLAQPGLSTIVPGCKDLAELTAAQAIWGAPPVERDFSPILADFAEYAAGECVYCNHCLPCPAGIDVGQTIRLLETASEHSRAEAQGAYAALSAPASTCSECGACAERCPFGVAAVEKIGEAARLFEGAA